MLGAWKGGKLLCIRDDSSGYDLPDVLSGACSASSKRFSDLQHPTPQKQHMSQHTAFKLFAKICVGLLYGFCA
jgi:hypothetical protein